MVARATSLASEPMLMILPPLPRAIIRRAASRPTWNAAVRCVSTTRRHSSVVSSSIGLRNWLPALLTRMSIATPSASKRSNAARTAASSATSNARAGSVSSRGLESFRRRRELVPIASVEHDRRAGFGESARHRETEAGGGAGDERGLAGEIEELRRRPCSRLTCRCPVRAPLVGRERHQTAVAPGRAFAELVGRQSGAPFRLDPVHRRAVPIHAPPDRRENAGVDVLVALGVVAHAARRVEIDRLEWPHERPAQARARRAARRRRPPSLAKPSATRRNASSSSAPCSRLTTKPSISRLTTIGACPAAASSATVRSTAPAFVHGAGTTSTAGIR